MDKENKTLKYIKSLVTQTEMILAARQVSPRTTKTLDCGWVSKVGLQKLVFKK
jgi:hypothetical protein